MLVHTPHSLKGKQGSVAWFEMHAGGGIGGSPELSKNAASYAAQHLDAVVFNPAYTLAGDGTAQELGCEVVSAIKYVIDNCDEFGINPNKIVLHGCSGGGWAVTVACATMAVNDESHLVKLAIPDMYVDAVYWLTTKK